MSDQDTQAGLRKIWLRYDNMRFVLIFSALLAGIGFVVMRALPPLGLVLELIAFLATYFFWWRYFLSPCPKCGHRFASLAGKLVFGFMKPSNCQHCGLSAGINPN